MKSLRLAVSLFSVIPVGVVRPDRRLAVAAVRWLPVVGALLGAFAALVASTAWHGGGSPLLGAVLAVGALALGTRGLHLDGLADLADGLGSGRPAEDALRVMRQSDIGPFGVAAILFAVLCQVASLAAVFGASPWALGVVCLVSAAATSRLAVVWAAARGVPAAHAGGFGALVADSASLATRLSVTAAVVAGVLGCAFVAGADGGDLARLAGSLAGALVLSTLVSRHAVRRLGGVTGDVFGGLVELTCTAFLVILAVSEQW